MVDPNIRAMTQEVSDKNNARAYAADGWWPLVETTDAGAVVFELGLNHHRTPLSSKFSRLEMYWSRCWVSALARLIIGSRYDAVTRNVFEPVTRNLFSHVFENTQLIKEFTVAYREHLESPTERLVTLTEYTLRVDNVPEAMNIDLDRARREVRIFERLTHKM